jgi:hypothetical protein
VILLVCAAFLTACRRDDRNKEKVEQAILDRLQTHSGLDLKTLDISTTALSFDKNLAYATVSFHPKGDSRLTSEMIMKYTLEDKDGKWVVVNVGDAQGHSMAHGHGSSAGGSQLPPGHPQVGDGPPPASDGKQ